MLSESYYLSQTLQIPATKTSLFAYNLQKIIDIILVSSSYALFVYLSIDKRLLTTSSQFPTFFLTPSSTLLQTVVLCPILHFLIVLYIKSTYSKDMSL